MIAGFAAESKAAEVPSATARGLGCTFRRLRDDRTLTVGYFGGSITEGAGASAPKFNWRERSMATLRERFPDANITEVSAAIGGTGSDLGAFRCQDDLLAHKPDLVFVEFAVNDFGTPEERTLRAMEGIVRQIVRAHPATDIVFVYTASKAMEPFYAKGETPPSVVRHQKVAAFYGIPEVNVGKRLYEHVAADFGGDWLKLTKEGVHPNDDGYAIYAKEVADFLAAHAGDSPAPDRILTAPMTAHPFEYGRLIDAWTLPDAAGWTREPKSLSGRYPHMLTAAGADAAPLSLPFHGDCIGLYWQIASDSGRIEWRIDDGPPQRRSSWDSYALRFSRANYALLADALTPGPHTLTVRVLPEKDAQSTGSAIRIGAFLVNDPDMAGKQGSVAAAAK